MYSNFVVGACIGIFLALAILYLLDYLTDDKWVGNVELCVQGLEPNQCSTIHLWGFGTSYRGRKIRKKLRILLEEQMRGWSTGILVVGWERNQRPMRQVLRSLRWWKVWNRYKAFRVCTTGSGSGGSLWVVKKRIWRRK